jgi:hypothetical protein
MKTLLLPCLGFALMSFTAEYCGSSKPEVYFRTPMPTDGEIIYEFPEEFAGTYWQITREEYTSWSSFYRVRHESKSLGDEGPIIDWIYLTTPSSDNQPFVKDSAMIKTLKLIEIDFPKKWIMRIKEKETKYVKNISSYLSNLRLSDYPEVTFKKDNNVMYVHKKGNDGVVSQDTLIFNDKVKLWEVERSEWEDIINLREYQAYGDDSITYVAVLKDKSLYINSHINNKCGNIPSITLYDFSSGYLRRAYIYAYKLLNILNEHSVLSRYIQVDTIVKEIRSTTISSEEEKLDTSYCYVIIPQDAFFEAVLRLSSMSEYQRLENYDDLYTLLHEGEEEESDMEETDKD